MQNPPTEANFCDDNGNPLKAGVVDDCNRYMGYVDKETE
jgi:hypothetical protein